MKGEHVLLQRKGNVSVLVLNDPRRKNALGYEMAQAFEEAIGKVAKDKEARFLIITGAGDCFSAGGDFKSIIADFNLPAVEIQPKVRKFYSSFLSITKLSIPVLAAVNGPAIGAGFSLAMACDMRIASKEASFHPNFLKLGVHPGLGASFLLPRLVGVARALELFWLAEPVPATKALEMGIVSRVVEPSCLMEEALELAGKISSLSSRAVEMVKKSVYMALEGSLEDLLERESYAQALCGETQEMKLAVEAFVERKKRRDRAPTEASSGGEMEDQG